MIQTEYYTTRQDGVVLVRTYSDTGMMIEQDGTGAQYAEAIDPENMHRTYTETDIPAEGDETAEDVLSMLEEAL